MGALTRRMKSNLSSGTLASELERQTLFEDEIGDSKKTEYRSDGGELSPKITISCCSCGDDAADNRRNEEQRRRMATRGWALHFLLAFVVLFLGISENHQSRKYIPVPTSINQEIDCDVTYINVMASSEKDADAVVCCNSKTAMSSSAFLLETSMCSSKSERLPLASRLAKFPEAWLLPLFPLLFRIFYMLCQYACAAMSSSVARTTSLSHAIRRLVLYFLVLNFRGWILYVLFNEIEDQFVQPVDSHCWYSTYLSSKQAESCAGRSFDFSDHIVLYYAQLLPIALVETLHSFQSPFWNQSNRFARVLVPAVVVGSHAYLQLITGTGSYKTTAFFHTPAEVVAGFAVSLVLVLPLLWLQCSTHRYWITIRSFFFR